MVDISMLVLKGEWPKLLSTAFPEGTIHVYGVYDIHRIV